jgi:pyrroloquinoline-quinone synthase
MTDSATRPTGPRGPSSPEFGPSSAEDFIARLRAQGARYHHLHPFHRRMDAGELTREELQRWVANRFYYQKSIPLKDGAILANCPEVEVRREWIQRIIDHDGTTDGTGGIESWLRLGEALGVSRDKLLSEQRVLPAVRYAVVVERCRTREQQEAAVAALRFKTEMLWAQLDAIERGDTQPPGPGA